MTGERRRRRWKGAVGTARAPAGAQARINVTPMIDVVMVLIIFFLLVGHLATERRGVVDLPEAAMGEREDTTRRPVVVLVGADGGVRIDGIDVPEPRLSAAIADAMARNTEAGRSGGVHVRAGRATAFGFVRPVLDACRGAGVREVQLAVTPEGTG